MRQLFRKRLILAALTIIIFVLLVPQAILAAAPKNIIFYIGDGMASTQRRVAEEVHKRKLAMNTLPVVGIYTTFSADSIVTDSASAATAMATGHKTENGVISMDAEGEISFETIAEAAKRLGKSVGLLTTTRLTHATPAAFGTHIESRGDENAIAVQYLEGGFEVLMGGGWGNFVPKSTEKSRRWDKRNLLKEFEEKGYQVLRTRNDLINLQVRKNTRVVGLFARSHLPYFLDRTASEPDLSEMTRAALKILSQNPKGFFLMVEGGRIDHAAHGNSPAAAIGDLLELDNAVKTGLEFGKENPSTLILVGGDHETGGMGMGIGGQYFMRPAVIKKVTRSEFGMGYGDVLENPDQAFAIFKKYTGIEKLSPEETEAIKLAIKNTKEGRGLQSPNKTYNPSWFAYTFSRILSQRSRIGWTSYAHTAHPIILTAGGPGSENFMGFYDNTDLCKKMASLWGITLKSWKVE
ncbi:MAG: alkaline phosphatase [Deltaproteobacteria bacterium]|nr:alkaline phosphatase [Deltaproteobacteria bacterium]